MPLMTWDVWVWERVDSLGKLIDCFSENRVVNRCEIYRHNFGNKMHRKKNSSLPAPLALIRHARAAASRRPVHLSRSCLARRGLPQPPPQCLSAVTESPRLNRGPHKEIPQRDRTARRRAQPVLRTPDPAETRSRRCRAPAWRHPACRMSRQAGGSRCVRDSCTPCARCRRSRAYCGGQRSGPALDPARFGGALSARRACVDRAGASSLFGDTGPGSTQRRLFRGNLHQTRTVRVALA